MKFLFVAIVSLCSAAVAQGPKVEVFGGYSYLNFDVPTSSLSNSSRLNTNGWETSAAVYFLRHVAAEANFAGHYRSNCGGASGLTCSSYSFLFGPKLSFGDGSRLTGFAHGLVGSDRLAAGIFGFSVSNNSLAAAAGGGVDYWVGRHIGVRIADFDYFFTRHLNNLNVPVQNNFRASAGIVFRFGGSSSAPTSTSRQPSSHERQPQMSRTSMPIPLLGVSVIPNEQRGAQIVEVIPGSAAELAGIRVGDTINMVESKPVHSPMELAVELSTQSAGSKVRIGYMVRGYWQSETGIILGQPPR